MSINLEQVRKYIVVPTLKKIDLYSLSAEQLVMATGMVESGFEYIDQIGHGGDKRPGPAYGFFQMEYATHNDIQDNYLFYNSVLAEKVYDMMISMPDYDQMQGNLYYACAMCRVHYRRIPAKLPEPNDIEGFAHYWKAHYNTYKGKGTIEGFIKKTKPIWKLYE